MSTSNTAAVEMYGISKTFGSVKALADVDFILRKGEVHALLGENGAGKSTLMKVLSGMYRADCGEIRVHGVSADIQSPQSAIEFKIGMVYQNFTLSPELTVLENIVLGSRIPFVVNRRKLKEKVSSILREYGLEVDLNAKVWQLSVGEQQRVEIVKCFYHNAEILILDEPTAVLTPPETRELMKMIRKAVEKGCSVVFISHKLHEVLEIADHITVFRKGRKIEEFSTENATEKSLSLAMVGREIDLTERISDIAPGAPILEVRNVCARNDKGVEALRSVCLTLREREILGIAAVSGNGQAELAEVITALRKVDSGEILLDGDKRLNKMSIRQISKAGVAHISEKRLGRALVPAFSIAQNLVLEDYDQEPYCKYGILQEKVIAKHGEELLREFNIAAPSAAVRVDNLSGGNVQKVVLAREITRNPRVLLAVNPTYGLDVGAIDFVQQCLLNQKEAGTAILLISEELDEVMRLSDRILVLSDGRVKGVFNRGEYNREKIGYLMTGGAAK